MRKLLVLAGLALFTGLAFADFDLGDLDPCNYPTLFGNPAHTMSGKAWLGDCITSEGENDPHWGNLDACDDGVLFYNTPWTPCTVESVRVQITPGPNYTNNPLWLNAWKDGNLDGDFCDELCGSEWIIQNVPVVPGFRVFTFVDPGVTDMGVYDGVFRFRLSGRSLGRMSFGAYAPFDCPNSPLCGNFASDSLGEVEDYIIEDGQLRVDLNSFEASPGDNRVTLAWSTASETDNDHFEIIRNDRVIERVDATSSPSGHAYSWVDNGVVNGTTYTYKLVSVDIIGNHDNLATESATPSAAEGVVNEYALNQNYPNPFNPSTSISFDLPESGDVTLRVFNMMGQEVAILASGNFAAGRHTVQFDGSKLSTGLYLYRIEANGFTESKKMLLIK